MSDDGDPREDLRARVRPDEPIPGHALVALRGGPDTRSLISSHARRLNRLFMIDGGPVWGVSVFVALDPTGPASAEGILRRRLMSYESVYLPTVGALRAAGFDLLPTFGRPHFTVLMGGLELAPALFDALGELQENPYAVREGGPSA
ncbi:MAG: hypothetical protein JWP02_2665 [Acidimicrobiales bacterium]|nr:hypothetical protein [Acidimicrobiales bacterium]